MSAPPAALIAALRRGAVARHMFFYLDHPTGAVRAWDGVGEYVLAGNTYLGVAGAASIEGVSNSRDPQNHAIAITVNAVPLSALSSVGATIRARVCTITAAFIDEAGVVLASRQIFAGLGDYVATQITENEANITVYARGKMADWAVAPQALYTANDQRARYPGDTGFDLVKSLEAAQVSGWGPTAEVTAGYVFTNGQMLFDQTSREPLGFAGLGVLATRGAGGGGDYRFRLMTGYRTGFECKEETSGALCDAALDTALKFGGARVYPTVAGDANTSAGKLVYPNTKTTANKLRKAAAIAVNGAATAETIVPDTSILFTPADGSSYRFLKRSGVANTPASGNWLALVFDAYYGVPVVNVATNAVRVLSSDFGAGSGVSLVEDVTGTAVTFNSGTGTLQVGGVNCVLSANGVVLSSGGRRIRGPLADSTRSFLRIFT